VTRIQEGETLTQEEQAEYGELQKWYAQAYKTSQQWYDELYPPNEKGNRALVIYDPDGWDRMNWEYSFEKERITREEFDHRIMMSTCMMNKRLVDSGIATEKSTNV
jgi:hypothetical protein